MHTTSKIIFFAQSVFQEKIACETMKLF